MSISSLWKKLVGIFLDLLETTKSWDQCTLSSNWDGGNAEKRMMNILSPHMPDSVFKERMSFIKSRGANCVHVFVCNKGDGEYAGYSICGNRFTPGSVDKNYANAMLKRLKEIRKSGYGIVLWLAADDSSTWNKTMSNNAKWYMQTLKSLGFFKYASMVVVGLEVDEYWSKATTAEMINQLRGCYSGKIGVHETSNKIDYADIADIMFYQTAPGKSPKEIATLTKSVVAKLGKKPMCFFELDRHANKKACEAALKAGAFAVGNY